MSYDEPPPYRRSGEIHAGAMRATFTQTLFEQVWELEPEEIAARYVATLPPDTTVKVTFP